MSRHLSSEQLLDVAEGVPTPAMVAHLRECERCRLAALSLSETVAVVTDVAVPEPSPFFWQQLSTRVRDAIAADDTAGAASTSRWRARWSSWPMAAAGAIALLLLAVSVAREPWSVSMPVEVPAASQMNERPVTGDASLLLLSDLAGDLNWDDAPEAGLSMSEGTVDRVVAELSDAERAELQRLLAKELSGEREAL